VNSAKNKLWDSYAIRIQAPFGRFWERMMNERTLIWTLAVASLTNVIGLYCYLGGTALT
jgi:hypothetical protein